MVDMSDVVDDGMLPGVGTAKQWPQGVAFFLDETACIRCALCIIRCPTDAITMNRYGAVMPAAGKVLPKESIDDEVHLDLTVASGRAIRPLPTYSVNGNGNGHRKGDLGELHPLVFEEHRAPARTPE
jgi:ferredoxin